MVRTGSGGVVVLTALPLEFRAVSAHVDDVVPRTHPAGTVFDVGAFAGTPWQVALAEIGEGNQSAAVITERAREWLEPEAVFFVGVAGSLKKDVALGDVVVATRVYAYHGGKETDDGRLARPRVWDAPHALEQQARAALRDDRWISLVRGTADVRRQVEDLRRDAARLPFSRAPRPATVPKVHFKPVAAGEVVLGSDRSALAQRLRTVYGDAVAVEMESAGVSQAAHLSGSLPVLSIRGISDHADGGKAKADAAGSQERAAAHAAAALEAVLGRMRPAAFANTGQTVRDVVRRPDLAPGLFRDTSALSPAELDSVRHLYPTERGEELLLVWQPERSLSLLTARVATAVVTTWGVRFQPPLPVPFGVAHTELWSCDFSVEAELRHLGPLPIEAHRLTVRKGNGKSLVAADGDQASVRGLLRFLEALRDALTPTGAWSPRH
ncbi:5'-methylthioadenosine/S-adenosylhomocysteine nucleosidase [Streptomyces sp. CB02400]|uniref:5'-methylthioadenosine/S-adenosylhomocysteine nucleosidase n=1 Tax=Streptomyces sp. CB02400 TaxID=1703944 RepID=UPI00093A37CF|nr:5'-methylthioadenosine/S-adenosylhomocysteine nucleosidase [Streptomyces sp. CB02400]